jgi:hypothetical protein
MRNATTTPSPWWSPLRPVAVAATGLVMTLVALPSYAYCPEVCTAAYRDVAQYVRDFPEFDLREANGLECYVDSEGLPAIGGSWVPPLPGTPGTGPEAAVWAADLQCGARHRFQL